MKRLIVCLTLMIAAGTGAEEASVDRAAAPADGSAPGGGDTPHGVIRLDETVISGNQELPKVLYILPWRSPSGLPDIELDAHDSELEVFRRLYPPAYRRELTYFESLEAAKSSLGTTAKSSLETTAKSSLGTTAKSSLETAKSSEE